MLIKSPLLKLCLKYLKTKKTNLIVGILSSLTPVLLSPLLFLGAKDFGSYTWIWIAINYLVITLFSFYIFSFLIMKTKMNQVDLMLLSKSKNPKQIYLSKWKSFIIYNNIFIIMNSIFISIILAIYSRNGTWFIPVLFVSVFSENILIILFLMIFSFFTISLKGKIIPIIVSMASITLVFGSGVGIKYFEDNRPQNTINYNYDPENTHNYVNMYYKVGDKIQKGIVESTNYKGTKENPSLFKYSPILENINPFNWLASPILAMSSVQLRTNELITKNNFNINVNHFTVSRNFFSKKQDINIVGLYPINIKPVFELNHIEVQNIFLSVYNSLKIKGVKESTLEKVGVFVSKGDVWNKTPDPETKSTLLNLMGLKGNAQLMYLLKYKRDLLKNNPDLFGFLEKNASKPFSMAAKSIYDSNASSWNLTNWSDPSFNKVISLGVIDEKQPISKQDYDFLSNIAVTFSKAHVKLSSQESDSKIVTLADWNKEFKNISTQKQWKEYVDKNSLKLDDARKIINSLTKLYSNFNKYVFKENGYNASEFHYQYDNKTAFPYGLTSISILALLSLTILILIINIRLLKKVNMKEI